MILENRMTFIFRVSHDSLKGDCDRSVLSLYALAVLSIELDLNSHFAQF